jgi:hypothetical protein
LSRRIQYHMRGNAEASTLRLTLGCLLAEELDIELRRVGHGKRLTLTRRVESGPEFVNGDETDRSCDCFSLGRILFVADVVMAWFALRRSGQAV